MIAEWNPSNTIALVAVVAGSAGTFAAGWWQWRIREADRSDQHRREAALALGPLYLLMSDVDDICECVDEAWISGTEAMNRYDALLDDWRKQKPAITALGLIYPGERERELATSLASEIDRAAHILGVHVAILGVHVATSEIDPNVVVEPTDGTASRAPDVYKRLTAARALLDELAAAIRGDAR